MQQKSLYKVSTTIKPALPLFALLLLVFTACAPDTTPEEDTPQASPISKITISGIPASFPLEGSTPSVPLETFKVYLNASNSQSPNVPPAAKGVARVSNATKQIDGTHTVTIQLQNPNPPNITDPNHPTADWSGTATYFSVVLSPKETKKYEENNIAVRAIWIKASQYLNEGKSNITWDKGLTVDFRKPLSIYGNLTPQAEALYRDIVRADKDIDPELK